MNKNLELAAEAGFICLYLFMWNLLLKNFPMFPVVKVAAIIFILSGAAAILLAKIKKQGLLISTVIGSMLGPLGVIILLYAAPDLRVYPEEEKDREFYKKISQQLDRHFLRIIPKQFSLFKSVTLPTELDQIRGYFGVKVERDSESNSLSVRQHIELFKQVYTKFNQEYHGKFASKFPGIEERISALDIEAEKYDQAMAAYVEQHRASIEFKTGFFNMLFVILASCSVLIGLVGLYYLFFTKQNPPELIEGVMSAVFEFLNEGKKTNWSQIKNTPGMSGFMLGILLIAGITALLNIFFPDLKSRIFGKKQ
jgi:hypothetical protein